MRSFHVITALTYLCLSTPAWSAPGFSITVQGSQDIHLAVPQPSGHATSTQSNSFWAILQRDLEISGYFNMLSSDAFLDDSGEVSPGSFSFENWNLINTDALVKTRLLPASDPQCDPSGLKMCADVYVYYAKTGELLDAKRYRTEVNQISQLAHYAADTVLQSTVGHPGFHRSHITAVGNHTGNKEIYILDPDGNNKRAVTRNGSINLSPAWAPNGKLIAWTSYKRGNPDLYVKDLRTGHTRIVSNTPGINASATFSPDSKKVALTRSENGDSDIYIIDVATGNTTQRLTNTSGLDVTPDFSPDGSQIVFASERSGGSQIYMQSALPGSQARRVTREGGVFTDPVFSPDGTQIVYVAQKNHFDVFVSDVDGTNVRRITQNMGNNEDPSWSPDGRYVIFTSTRSGKSDIYISTINGAHQHRLTTSGGWSQPTWTP